jgi:hypothetical protein
MRRGISWVLIFLGSFALVAGIALRFWAADELKRTPLSVDSVTRLEGTMERLDLSTGETDTYPVKVRSVNQSDDEVSDDDVAVFVSSLCVVRDEPGAPDCDTYEEGDEDSALVTASTDTFATDRRTALSVDNEGYLPEDAVQHQGLVNKWPFGVERRDYPYWDGVLGEAVPATYEGTEDIDGLETYVFRVQLPRTPAEISSGVDGLYELERTMNVDPVTGQLIRQQQVDRRYLPDGTMVTNLQVAFTDDQVESNVQGAKDDISRLGLVSTTLPIIAIVVGVVLLGLGILLLLRGRPATGTPRTQDGSRAPVPA